MLWLSFIKQYNICFGSFENVHVEKTVTEKEKKYKDTIGVMRNSNAKDKQCHGERKRDEKTHIDPEINTQTTKDWSSHESH